MRLRAFSLVALTCLPGLAAQNLIVPGRWQPGPLNPRLANIKRDNAVGLMFNPACQATTPCAPRPWTGIYQDVTLRQGGTYQLEFMGTGGGTGSLDFEIVVDNQVLWKFRRDGSIAFVQGVNLRAGRHRIEFRSLTTTFGFPDSWDFAPPRLVRTLGPALILRGYDQLSVGPFLTVQSPANLLAVSLDRLRAPIPLPGVTHALELDPTSMLVLAVQASPGIRLDLGSMMPASILVYPKFYLQSASWSAFGRSAPTRR